MKFQITSEMPPDWQEACRKSGAFFHGHVWHDILRNSFNMDTVYVWDKNNRNGVIIDIFRIFLFRIGYITFPQGAYIDGSALDNDLIQELLNQHLGKKIHLLRFTDKDIHLTGNYDYNVSELPNTVIYNLQEWNIKKLSSSVRYSINRAKRSGFNIVESYDSSLAADIFNLYASVIRKNRGNIRYSENYFSKLLEYGRNVENIKCYLSMLNNNLIGFIVIIIHNDSAYYLHGASDDNYRKDCPSYGLMNEAINWAQEKGLQQFDMMTSPPDQPSLVKYKEKWGGISFPTKSYSLNLNKPMSLLFSGLVKLNNLIS